MIQWCVELGDRERLQKAWHWKKEIKEIKIKKGKKRKTMHIIKKIGKFPGKFQERNSLLTRPPEGRRGKYCKKNWKKLKIDGFVEFETLSKGRSHKQKQECGSEPATIILLFLKKVLIKTVKQSERESSRQFKEKLCSTLTRQRESEQRLSLDKEGTRYSRYKHSHRQ